jgi:hypothetical protein
MLVLGSCALLASYLPARRAASVNPVEALWAEQSCNLSRKFRLFRLAGILSELNANSLERMPQGYR